ncbi:galactokinase [Schaalia sp. Marseille-Q2122]|uniref:galactokinase n=1 Tax=Schaalia sp. Marseille-Q2122 TaxID=2736604 RepID=UPI0015886BE5|nr:galactokinase [Schaalia sp. Marseille-Q2122]
MTNTPDIIWTPAASTEDGARNARELFTRIFGGEAEGVWRAPGRVNIIGEHVDYNGGPCLPIALPHAAYVAVRPRPDRRVRLVSPQTVDAVDELDLDTVGPVGSAGAVKGWAAYLIGVAWALEQAGYGPLAGFDIALWSCVPLGAGLSSSAALECSTAVALDDLAGLGLAGSVDAPNKEGRGILVAASRRAENEIAGANTGGLDQSASMHCTRGHALVLDSRDMSVRQTPFDIAASGCELLVIDTRAPHQLVDGQYGQRRADCEAAATLLGVDLLVDVEDYEAAMATLAGEGAESGEAEEAERARLQARTRHVLSEIARTKAFIEILESAPLLSEEKLQVLGGLMNDSHDSLRDDYEVTVPELDVAVDVARARGAYGARMTGGGFGGSVIALVKIGQGEEIAQAVTAAFADHGFAQPHVFVATPADGAGRVE